ncbi:MAG TPA: LLM class flavin-dependent oxidoreductase [Methylomirabilota bacterium]|nr:LLM class flavin-dependent oxidoreductase [Methylomirabilota bacterium]
MASLGVAFDGRNPLDVLQEQARAAEMAGASTLWMSSHLFLRDPFTMAALVLEATQTPRVALMAVSPHAVHPVHIAMAAATLDELAPGRVVLCLGTGAPGDLADAGVEPRRPLRMLAEAVEAVRLLLSGEPARYAGELVRLRGRRMGTGRHAIPVFLAASHPRSLELAGRIADGVVLSTASSVEFVRWCLEHVERGARGRRLVCAGLVYATAADRPADALGRFRRQLAITLRAPHHARNLELAGAKLDQPAVREALAREDWAAVEALVTDETVRRHTACGTPQEMRARLAAYRAAGLDEIVLAGLYEPEETRRSAAAALDGET